MAGQKGDTKRSGRSAGSAFVVIAGEILVLAALLLAFGQTIMEGGSPKAAAAKAEAHRSR